MADRHTNRTSKQDLLTTDVVDPENGWDREDKLEDTRNTGSQEGCRISSQFKAFEDLRRVVVDGIDSVPLLEKHDQALQTSVMKSVKLGIGPSIPQRWSA